MITLQEIFDNLATGELSGLSIGNSQAGSIVEADYPKIVAHINLGLVDLYKRFPLRQGEIQLHQHADVTTYYLRSDHVADVDSMDEDFYIEEVDDVPFLDDIIKVTEVTDSLGDDVGLNDTNKPLTGVFTPSFDIIKSVPYDPPEILSITYQAKYPKITISDPFDPEDVKLYIPDFIIEALMLYVAMRIYRGMNSRVAEGETNIGTTFFSMYETECQKLTALDVFADVNDSGKQFVNNGWI